MNRTLLTGVGALFLLLIGFTAGTLFDTGLGIGNEKATPNNLTGDIGAQERQEDRQNSENMNGTGQAFDIGGAALARTNATNDLVAAPNATFKRGESVYMFLTDIGPLQRGEDDLHEFDLSGALINHHGTVVVRSDEFWGEEGHVDIPGSDVNRTFIGFSTNSSLHPGRYTFAVTAHDQVTGLSDSVALDFVLE